MRRTNSLIDNIDWFLVSLYFILMVFGWLNIYAAVYNEEFQSIFITKTAEDLEILLNNFDVPAGKIRSLPEAVAEKQFKERKLWNKINIKSINKDFLVPSIGFKVDKSEVSPKNPPPTLGENTKEVLQNIGIKKDLLVALKKEGVIN